MPEKKVFYAMAIASYARAAGDIPDIQDRAAEVILNTAPALRNEGQRHNAIAFAQRHAVTAGTQARAAEMMSKTPISSGLSSAIT
jgi:thiazole synthase ThiGH ThiG subunit